MEIEDRRPDIEDRIRAGLGTEIIGHPVVVCRSVGSTNDVAKELALRGAPDGLAVVTLDQTSGRGRRGRSWAAFGEKAIYTSFVLKPEWPVADVSWLGVLGGVAVAAALHEAGVAGLTIKWPNDILVGGKKVAGILVEPRVGEERLAFAVLGIGLNLAQEGTDWPEELRDIATSCAEQGVRITWEDAIRLLLRHTDHWYRMAMQESRRLLLDAWSHWSGSARLPVIE